MPKKNITVFTAIAIFILTLGVYFVTLSRSVYPGDSGEFITAAKTLGIPHPPGYPLYTMLAHLFTYLPFGNIAFKVNLFSAVTSSISVVLIFLSIRRLTKSVVAAASGSLILGFSYSFWLYSLVADTYSLNNLFISLIVYLSISLLESPSSNRVLYFLAFIFGLSLTHHGAILFLAPALIFLAVNIVRKQGLKPYVLITASLFFVIGLLPYLYLPIRASRDPLLNWGNPDTLGRFLNLILRRDYGTFNIGPGASDNPFNLEVMLFYFSSIFRHFVFVGTALAIIGFLFYQKTKEYLFLILAFLSLGPILIFFSRIQITANIDAQGAIQELFSASYTPLGIWVGVGVWAILEKTKISAKRWLSVILLALFLIPLISNFTKVNQSNNSIYEETGENVFKELPQNSILFVDGDMLSIISDYLQIVKGERPDLKIINIGLISNDWYRNSIEKRYAEFVFPFNKTYSREGIGQIICDEVSGQYPIFLEDNFELFNGQSRANCTNFLYKNLWIPKHSNFNQKSEELLADYKKFWEPHIKTLESIKKPQDLRTRAILLHKYSAPLTYLGFSLEENFKETEKAHEIYQNAFNISSDNGIALYLSARKYLRDNNLEKAAEIEKQAIRIDPLQAEPYRTLGILYLNKNDKKKALYYFKKYLKLAPTGAEKQQIENIVKQIEQEL